MSDEDGLYGIDEPGLDEAAMEMDDVTTVFSDADPDEIVVDTGINEEIMLINDDVSFDLGDVGLHNPKTEYINKRELPKVPIKTRYGTIWCNGYCEACPHINICTKAVDTYINGLSDLSATKKRPRCKPGYKLMRNKSTGRIVCRKASTSSRSSSSSARCKPGYKLMRNKKTGKVVCRKQSSTSSSSGSKSPFTSFWVFKKKESDPSWLKATYSFGNFAFFALVILGISVVAPKVIQIGKHATDYGIDTWKKVKEVKLIGKR